MGRLMNELTFRSSGGGNIEKPLDFISWGETKKRNGGGRVKKIILRSSYLATCLREEVTRLQDLVSTLATEIDLKNQKISRMKEERDHLNQAHCEEMRHTRRVVYENGTFMRELETQRRELEQKRKDIDKREAQLDLKSQQLPALSEKCERSGENVQALTEVNDMRKKLEEKDYELESLINLNNALIAKEYRSNQELQEARKVLIEGLDGFASMHSRPVIGIKRMGELNEKPFRDICIKKFLTEERETKYVELCSLWQKNVQDSEWYPYKNVTIDKELHEVIDEDDEKLRELKDEWGEDVHDAVCSAALEMNQYNASGRYPVRELWNFKEGRQASLKEVMEYVLQKLKALKGVRRRR